MLDMVLVYNGYQVSMYIMDNIKIILDMVMELLNIIIWMFMLDYGHMIVIMVMARSLGKMDGLKSRAYGKMEILELKGNLGN